MRNISLESTVHYKCCKHMTYEFHKRGETLFHFGNLMISNLTYFR